ncbi:MAG: hypothetical protein RR313_12035, partial [Anaerovoracaceae bacterium]
MEEEKKKRGRPKKATAEQLEFIDFGIQKLGLGESLQDFAEKMSDDGKRKMFAMTLAQQMQSAQSVADQMAHNGSIQPILSQNYFQKINTNPMVATSEDIELALQNPNKNGRFLRSISQYLSYTVGNYNRALYYFNTIKSYNYELIPFDTDSSLIGSDEYMVAYRKVLGVLGKLNIKYQAPKIDLQCQYDGVATYWINEMSDSIQFTQLPSDWVYLTAPWAMGYRASFDLTYFDRYMGMEIAIPELWDAYKHFVVKREEGLSGDKLAPIQYYPLPIGKHWVFSFDPIHPDACPPLSSSLGAGLDVLTYRGLTKQIAALDIYKVIALKIPTDKQDKLLVTYDMAAQITQVIQSTLPENIKVFTSPFESEAMPMSQENRFEKLIGLANENFNTSVGVQQGNFGGDTLKQSGALDFSGRVDFEYASKHMYTQMANCVNYLIGKVCHPYKFKVQFFGNALRRDDEIKMYG